MLISTAAPYACIDFRLVPAILRQLYAPARGFTNLIRSAGNSSSSRETASSALATPFTAVIATLPPACLGSQRIVRKFLATSLLLQSPYMATNRGSKRTRPGSIFIAGCAGDDTSGYRA